MPAKDTLAKAFNVFHRNLFEISKGKGLLGAAGGMRAVKLTTTGRKSGKERETMLTTPITVGDEVILVASWGGDDRHPMWYLNLQANPEVTVMHDGKEYKAIARTLDSDEKAEIWPKVTSKYKGYAGYQEKTDRDIPLVGCKPV